MRKKIMYVTKIARFQKKEIPLVVDFLTRCVFYLENQKKFEFYARLYLDFVVKKKSMAGWMWNSAVKWAKDIKHHSVNPPVIENKNGSYTRSYYDQKSTLSTRRWHNNIDQAALSSFKKQTGMSKFMISMFVEKLRSISNLSERDIDLFDEYLSFIVNDLQSTIVPNKLPRKHPKYKFNPKMADLQYLMDS